MTRYHVFHLSTSRHTIANSKLDSCMDIIISELNLPVSKKDIFIPTHECYNRWEPIDLEINDRLLITINAKGASKNLSLKLINAVKVWFQNIPNDKFIVINDINNENDSIVNIHIIEAEPSKEQ